MQAIIKRTSSRHYFEKGAVSLFVVLFATLLITVVTVSFVRTMVDNQLQSTNQNLADSAYDSAQAGVQDAERALLRYETCQNAGSCSLADASAWNNCNGIISSQLGGASNVAEVPIQQTGDGQDSVNQAYTCVKVNLDTNNVVGSADESGQLIIPLQGTGNFTNIEVSWFSKSDLSSGNNTYTVSLPNSAASMPLQQQYNASNKSGWSPSTPPVLRAQLIQFSSSGFKLTDFDNLSSPSDPSPNNSGTDSATLFLYPVSSGAVSPASFSLDGAKTPMGPVAVNCSTSLSAGGYACNAILTLPTPVNGNADGSNRVAYLRLTPMYNASHFSVSLLNGTDPVNDIVQFSNVQPSIDSTGRANDLFARIQTRVNLINNYLPYPTDAVEVTGNFCKNFAVTNNTSDYAGLNAGNTCKP